MSTTKEVQVSQSNSGVLAAEISAAVDAGRVVKINGDTVVQAYESAPARSYSTGSLSYRVAAKKPGATREVFVKAGHMAVIESDAPDHHGPAPHATVKPSKRGKSARDKVTTVKFTESAPAKAKGDKSPIPATVKGETGYLTVRTVEGHYRYGVTMDEKSATLFAPGGSTERHAKRAEAAGIKIAA